MMNLFIKTIHICHCTVSTTDRAIYIDGKIFRGLWQILTLSGVSKWFSVFFSLFILFAFVFVFFYFTNILLISNGLIK